MSAQAQELLEFVIRLKMQELKTGLQASAKEIATFDDKAKRHFADVGRETDKLGAKGKELEKDWTSSLKKMEDAGGALTRASGVAFAAIAASIGVATKAYADFETQMNTLQAVSGANAEQMAALDATAQRLGATTKFSASQMAETSVELAKLGFVSDEIIGSIEGIVSAAAASGVSLRDAGELVAGTIRGFSLEAKDAGFVADVLAKAANTSALSMADLQLSMKYVAPVAAASGQSLTDMTAIMGLLSNNMIKGENAGTALRAMMVRLQAPSGEAEKVIEKLGIKVSDAAGKMKPFPQLIGELQSSMKGLKSETQNKVLAELFGQEALAAASVLMKTSNEELKAMTREMENAGGASAEMAGVMQQGINHQLDLLKSAAEGAAIAFGEKLAPNVELAITQLTNFLDALNSLPDPFKDAIIQVGLLSGGLAAAGLAFGGFKKVMAIAGVEVVALTGKFKALHAAILGIPGLIGLGIGTAANLLINNETDKINTATDALDQSVIDDKTGQTLGNSTSKLNNIKAAYEKELADIAALEKKYKAELTGSNLETAMALLTERRAKAALAMQSMASLSADALKSTISEIETEKTRLNKSIEDLKKKPQELNDLQAQLDKELSKGGRSALAASLQEKIKGINLTDVNKQLRETNGQIARLNGLQAQFKSGLDKRAPEKTETDTALENALAGKDKASDDAAKAEETRLKTQTDKYFDDLDNRLTGFKQSLDRQKALAEQSQASVTDSGSKLAEAAMVNVQRYSAQQSKSLAKFTGNCWREVWHSLQAAGMADDLKDVGAAAAYMAIPGFEKSKSWKEMQWDKKSTLPAGAVTIWERGSSAAGHISIADGKGNEISDALSQQGTQHRGGGNARVFVHKDANGQGGEVDSKKYILALQQEYNKEIQKAIQFQSQLPATSKAWADAEKQIQALKKEGGQLGIDLIAAETEARKKAAAEAQKLQEEQKRQFLAMLQEVQTIQQTIQQETAGLAKQLAQAGMNPIEKAKDDFDRGIKAYQGQIEQLKGKLTAANVSEGQRKTILEDIKGLDKDILDLNTQQNTIIGSMQSKKDFEQWKKDKEQALELDRASYVQMEKQLDLEQSQVDAKKRRLDLDVRLGQLNPEQRAKKLLEINHEDLEILDSRLLLVTEQLKTETENEALKKRQLELQGQITQKTDEQLILSLDISEAEAQRFGQARQMLTENLAIMLRMAEVPNEMANGIMNFAQAFDKGFSKLKVSETEGWGENAKTTTRSAAPNDIISGKILNPGNEASIASMALDAGIAWGNGVRSITKEVGSIWFGDPVAMEEAKRQHIDSMMQIEYELTQLKIEQAKSRGENTEALEAEQIERSKQMKLRALADQERDLKNATSGFFGLVRSSADDEKLEQFYEEAKQKRIKIEAEANQQIEVLRASHLEKMIAFHEGSQQSLLNIRAGRAALTDDPQDDLDAEWNQRRWDARQKRDGKLKEAFSGKYTQGQSAQMQQEAYDQVNVDFRNIDKDIDAKRKKADAEVKGEKDKQATKTVTLGLLREENALLAAQRTDDPYDDIIAASEQELAQLRQAKEEALKQEGLTEEQKAQIRENYRQKELTARDKFQKQIESQRKSDLARVRNEYKEQLGIQREYIQDSLDADRKEWDDKIKTAEKSLKAIRDTIEKHERTLEKSRKDREQDQKEFDPEDAVQSKKFNSDLAGFDADALAWKGVDEISNVIRRDGLANVSGETARKGLLEEAELQEMEAQNLWRQEKITQQEYINRMQKAQLMRAKAAEMELDTEELTTRRKLELQGEWADAYVKWQELARQSIDARYDAADQRTRDNIELERQNEQQQQQTLDSYQAKITALQEVADEKLKLIDAEIKNVDRSTRDAASAWTDVQSGIAGTRAEMDKLLAQYERMPANLGAGALGFSSGGSSGAGQPTGSVANLGKNYASGTDGKQYTTTSDMIAAERGVKAASGGFTPFNSQYQGDKYGPIFAQPGEALIPFERWPEILRPFMPPSGGGGSRPNLSLEVNVTGNHIVGEFDFYNVAHSAATDVLQTYASDVLQNTGQWS